MTNLSKIKLQNDERGCLRNTAKRRKKERKKERKTSGNEKMPRNC